LVVNHTNFPLEKKKIGAMKTEKTVSDLIKEQIKLEKEIAEKLGVLGGRLGSIAARLLIREMQLDTKKSTLKFWKQH